jgi:hypothetical protein
MIVPEKGDIREVFFFEIKYLQLSTLVSADAGPEGPKQKDVGFAHRGRA